MKLEQTTRGKARPSAPLTFDFYTTYSGNPRKTRYNLRRLPFALPTPLNPLWAWLRGRSVRGVLLAGAVVAAFACVGAWAVWGILLRMK